MYIFHHVFECLTDSTQEIFNTESSDFHRLLIMYAYIIPVEQSLIELVLPVLLTSISGFISWNVHISLYIRVSDGFYPRNIEHRVLKFPQIVDNVCIYNTCRTKFDRISTSGVINFDIRIYMLKCTYFTMYLSVWRILPKTYSTQSPQISLYIRVSDGFYPRNIEHRVLKFPQTVDNVCIYNTCRTKFDRISTSGVINFDIRIYMLKCTYFTMYLSVWRILPKKYSTQSPQISTDCW